MEQSKNISVVVPTLNDSRHLPRCLSSLIQAAIDGLVHQVVVVDGGSSDATIAIAEEIGADVIDAQGDAQARIELGVRRARRDIVLLMPARAALTTGWEAEAAAFIAAKRAATTGAVFPHARGLAALFDRSGALLIARALYLGKNAAPRIRLRSRAALQD